MLKASKLFDVEDSFYLTDEECKFAYDATDDFITSDRFYLTDEECKFENKAVCNRITRCFYLTDEECK